MSRAQMNTNKRRGAAQMHSTPSFTYSAFLHLPQLSGQNLLSYMTDGLFQLSKTLCARHQIPEDQHLPFIADEGQGGLHRAGREFFEDFLFHNYLQGNFKWSSCRMHGYHKPLYGIIIAFNSKKSKQHRNGIFLVTTPQYCAYFTSRTKHITIKLSEKTMYGGTSHE